MKKEKQKETTTRVLPVEITDKEELELGRSIAEMRYNIENLKVEKSVKMRDFSDKIKGMENTLSETSKYIRDKSIPKVIECYWINNEPEKGIKTLHRSDTHETVETANMDLFDEKIKVDD